MKMPSVEGNWLQDPLGVIQVLFERSLQEGTSLGECIQKYFAARLDKGGLQWVPSLNDVMTQHVPNNSLVRFRCMVQDMFGPEYYLETYSLENASGEKKRCSGRCRDIADCPPDFTVTTDSPDTVTCERHTFYCVPLPAETPWAKEEFRSQGRSSKDDESVEMEDYTARPAKRGREDGDELASEGHSTNSTELDQMSTVARSQPEAAAASYDENKRPYVDTSGASGQPSGLSPAIDLNFPLPGENGTACLVKVYEDVESYRVNDMMEFVGILSVDPAMASMPSGPARSVGEAMIAVDADLAAEEAVHCPPPSLVPRLHCVFARRLLHSNPLLPADEAGLVSALSSVPGVLSEAGTLRSELLHLLTGALGGDALAAEYLLLHLISNVYARHDVTIMGKFALNISGWPASARSGRTQQLFTLLQQLLPKCHLMPMSLDQMNSARLCPKKDYQTNRLLSGQLQLSNNTELILDETVLSEGQLADGGVANVMAIQSVLSGQRLAYDFQFHKTDFPANLNMLVLSEGTSMLQCDCHVKLQPTTEVVADLPVVDGQLLNRLRAFITSVQHASYGLSADVQTVLQDDFVAMRRQNPEAVSAETFHLLLSIARMKALSKGRSQLDLETWTEVKAMESQRKACL